MRELTEYDGQELQLSISYPDSSHQRLAVQKGETPEELAAFLLQIVPWNLGMWGFLRTKQLFCFVPHAPEGWQTMVPCLSPGDFQHSPKRGQLVV